MDENLYLPPLRERPEDIANLAERMLAYFGQLYHRPELSLEPEAKLALARYTWPGNVHELRDCSTPTGKNCRYGRLVADEDT
jgi:transcriptional regulator with GAF, ATPase, and Fis domain